jgi:predicted ester cyclase
MNISRAVFPDFHNAIEALIDEGDHATARLTYTGTHQGGLLSIVVTDKKVI